MAGHFFISHGNTRKDTEMAGGAWGECHDQAARPLAQYAQLWVTPQQVWAVALPGFFRVFSCVFVANRI